MSDSKPPPPATSPATSPETPSKRALPAPAAVSTESFDLKGRYLLTFHVRRTETDLADTFLRGGATLGGAVVRGEADFGVTVQHGQAVGSSDPTTFAAFGRVTESAYKISVLLPKPSEGKLQSYDSVKAFTEAARSINLDDVDVGERTTARLAEELYRLDTANKRLSISRRARLNVTATRGAPAINGVIVSTMSGQGSIRLHDLWRTTDDKKVVPAVVQLPVVYAGWTHHSAVFSVSDASIQKIVKTVTTTTEGGETEVEHETETLVPLNVDGLASAPTEGAGDDAFLFTPDPTVSVVMREVEPQLKMVFEAAWERRQKLVYKPSPYLTKSVARLPVGVNGSGYTLASSVNDVLPAFTDDAVEELLGHCLDFFVQNDETEKKHLETLADHASLEAARHVAYNVGSALSLYQAVTKPYRVDGTPVVMPGGTKMIQAESWLMEPSRTIETADDCDGSASSVIAVINACVAAVKRADSAHPKMRAVGRLFHDFYVYGVSVLGATAGHAGAATDAAPQVAGHAVAIALPKREVARALKEGAEATLDGKPVYKNGARIEPNVMRHDALHAARDDALFPDADEFVKGLIAKASSSKEAETVKALYGDALARRKPVSDPARRQDVPPLAMEGTAAAESRLFTLDPKERQRRHEQAVHDRRVSQLISPSVARNCALLDASGLDPDTKQPRHGFYSAFVELSVSTRHPLFTHQAVRALDAATPHLVLTNGNAAKNAPVDAEDKGAGATPAQLACGEFSAVPLWTTGTRGSNILSTALDEARMNILQRREAPLQLSTRQTSNLIESLSSLQRLKRELESGNDGTLDQQPQRGTASHMYTEQVISYAALINNPKTIECYVDSVLTNLPAGTHGSVVITKCSGLATFLDAEHARQVAVLDSGLEAQSEVARKLLSGEVVEANSDNRASVLDVLRSFFKRVAAVSAANNSADASVSLEAGRIVTVCLGVAPDLLPPLAPPNAVAPAEEKPLASPAGVPTAPAASAEPAPLIDF